PGEPFVGGMMRSVSIMAAPKRVIEKEDLQKWRLGTRLFFFLLVMVCGVDEVTFNVKIIL
ncbi:Hypothetical protein FKW44_010975, partial [Caligus rogercresseyi]